MAAIAGSVLQTTFAAVSFAGAGFLFKMFDHNGYAAEMKRHNKSLEQLADAKEKFYENEVRQHDRIQQLQHQLELANQDMVATNKALDALAQIRSISFGERRFTREPTLDDFYKPSSEMHQYQQYASVAIGVGTVLLGSRLV